MMSPAPSVAVVIPTHNRPGDLRSALASVMQQTSPVDEIIVVDDGSDEPVVLADQPSQGPTQILIRNAIALGPSAARNLGAATASTEVIAFLDDDDRWHSDKLRHVRTAFASHPEAGMVFHGVGMEPQLPDDPAFAVVREPLRWLVLNQAPHLSGVAVRRQLHLRQPFDEEMAAVEDIDYLIRLARAATVVRITSVLAHHDHLGAPTAIGTQHRIEGRLQLRRKHPELFADRKAAAFFSMRLGQLYRRSGQSMRAYREFAKALALDPLMRPAWGGLFATAMRRR